MNITNLAILNLSHNKIGNEGIQIISEIIGCRQGHNLLSKSLKTLNLSHNNIKSLGIEIFSRNMMQNQTLTELYL